jgi:hypothetical protein
MRNIRNPLHLICIAVVLSSGLACQTVNVGNGSDVHKGEHKVRLQYVHAVQMNGSPDPAHDADCEKQLSQPTSKFVGMPVSTKYDINSKTLMMSAESMFPSPVTTQPLEIKIGLDALGLRGTYAFGKFRPAGLSNVYAVLFSIKEDFTDPVSTFVVFGPPEQQHNCVISSAMNAARLTESGKFKAE